MKKIFLSALFIFVSVSLMAEDIPTDYYININGKQDSILKTTLHNIVCGGERYRYGTNTYHSTNNSAGQWQKGDFKAMGTWGAFSLTDIHSDGSVWDMYGSAKRYFPLKGQSAAGLEIEHCFPKSWWGASATESEYQADLAYCDLYHLNPADAIANTNKSNYPPGNVINADKFDNGSFKMGKNSNYGNFYVFEPADEYKGDFARAYFYIATAYEDRKWVETYSQYISNQSYLVFQPWLQQVLLEWHRQDPVSEKEIKRQETISSIQHNRNPYIDYPELVEYIWGNKQGEKVDLDQLTLTCSDNYVLPLSADNPIAYEAQNICKEGFLASWSNTAADSYMLDVFTVVESGSNDTLLSLPLVSSDSIKANEHIAWTDDKGAASTFSTTDGKAALYMSTTTAKKHFVISGLQIGTNARLTVKCSVYNKGDKDAVLVVKADDNVIAEQAVGLDEQYHTFAVPAQTKVIDLSQKEIGTKSAYHRISMQQIYLTQGDYQRIEEPIEGYPKNINATATFVAMNWNEGDVVNYRVRPNNAVRESNVVSVMAKEFVTTSIENNAIDNNTINAATKAQKLFINGNIIIVLPNGEHINILGEKL